MNQQIPRNISANDLHDWLVRDSEKPLLIDVREQEELAISSFPAEVLHLPLSQTQAWVEQLPEALSINQQVVVICHSGIRSWNFAAWLLDQGLVEQVWNLEGGIDSWSIEVDPNIPRY